MEDSRTSPMKSAACSALQTMQSSYSLVAMIRYLSHLSLGQARSVPADRDSHMPRDDNASRKNGATGAGTRRTPTYGRGVGELPATGALRVTWSVRFLTKAALLALTAPLCPAGLHPYRANRIDAAGFLTRLSSPPSPAERVARAGLRHRHGGFFLKGRGAARRPCAGASAPRRRGAGSAWGAR